MAISGVTGGIGGIDGCDKCRISEAFKVKSEKTDI
jgi:hypothetical protein